MKLNIEYSITSLHEVGKFIWENNPSVHHWTSAPKSEDDVIYVIRENIKKHALNNAHLIIEEGDGNLYTDYKWRDWIGTGGYYLLFTLEHQTDDEITIQVDILFDPAVGKEREYAIERIDISSKTIV